MGYDRIQTRIPAAGVKRTNHYTMATLYVKCTLEYYFQSSRMSECGTRSKRMYTHRRSYTHTYARSDFLPFITVRQLIQKAISCFSTHSIYSAPDGTYHWRCADGSCKWEGRNEERAPTSACAGCPRHRRWHVRRLRPSSELSRICPSTCDTQTQTNISKKRVRHQWYLTL